MFLVGEIHDMQYSTPSCTDTAKFLPILGG